MGLRVSRALTVAAGDGYAWFLYYVPTNTLQFGWVDTWMEANFDRVAERVGEGAVLIAPFESRRETYVKELAGAVDWSRLDRTGRELGGTPALIATRLPLRAGSDHEATVIDLSRARTEPELTELLDAVATRLRDGGPLTGREDGVFRLLSFLELKPNIAGVGLNVNAIADWYQHRRRPRRFRLPRRR